MEDMWKYAAGGALIGIVGMLAGFWGKVKGVLWRVANLFVQQVEIPTEEAHNALVAFLIAHHKRSRMYDRMYGAWYAHRREKGPAPREIIPAKKESCETIADGEYVPVS